MPAPVTVIPAPGDEAYGDALEHQFRGEKHHDQVAAREDPHEPEREEDRAHEQSIVQKRG